MQKKTFKLEEVISAARGILLCPIDKVYEVLNFLTGDNLMTHQLPRAGKDCQPGVYAQHPFIEQIDLSGINPDTWEEKLKIIKSKYPNEVELTPIDKYEAKDPLQELIEKKGGSENVIVVTH